MPGHGEVLASCLCEAARMVRERHTHCARTFDIRQIVRLESGVKTPTSGVMLDTT